MGVSKNIVGGRHVERPTISRRRAARGAPATGPQETQVQRRDPQIPLGLQFSKERVTRSLRIHAAGDREARLSESPTSGKSPVNDK